MSTAHVDGGAWNTPAWRDRYHQAHVQELRVRLLIRGPFTSQPAPLAGAGLPGLIDYTWGDLGGE